jgi:sarcosine dehydrogenase
MSAEKNYKHWHEDLRPDDTPLEAGLAFACKLKTDVDFLGRAALEAQRERGIQRRLAAFTVPSDVPLFGLEGVYRDGESVGYLRRAAPAFSVDRTIGFAYVERPASDDSGKNVTPKWIREGTYELDVMGKRIPAEVHTRAVFDPDGLRIRGVYDRAAEAPAAVEASMK